MEAPVEQFQFSEYDDEADSEDEFADSKEAQSDLEFASTPNPAKRQLTSPDPANVESKRQQRRKQKYLQ